MRQELIDNPETLCLRIHGQFRTGPNSSLIYQRSNGGQQKKLGPIIPTNPKSQRQTIARILFLGAKASESKVTETDKPTIRSLDKSNRSWLVWRHVYYSLAIRQHQFGRRRFGFGIFRGQIPRRPVLRFGNLNFGDAFFSRLGDVPTELSAVAAAYPNLDIANL